MLIAEDLPNLNNLVHVKGEQIILEYTNNNEQAFNRLIQRLISVLKTLKLPSHKGNFSLFILQKMSLKNVTHQCGLAVLAKIPPPRYLILIVALMMWIIFMLLIVVLSLLVLL